MKKINLLLLVALPAMIACQAEADPDIRAAALVIGANNATNNAQSLTDLSSSAQTGATGAVAASTVAGSGLNTALWLRPGKKEAALQLALRRALGKQGFPFPGRLRTTLGPRAMATDFSCDGAPGNDCDLGGTSTQYLLNGVETCSLDGTVEAVNVPVFLDSQNSLRVFAVDGGAFEYADCEILNVDYADFPNFKVQRLNGETEMFGEMISSIVETPSTFAGFFFSETQVFADPGSGFNVNGTDVVMNVHTSSTMSFNMLFDPGTHEPINGIVSGTVHLIGSIQGEDVDLNLSFVENLGE